jgi:hypothetical protein
MFAGCFPISVLVLFLLRQGSVFFILGSILRRIESKDLIAWIPVFDAGMGIQYGTLIPWLLWSKKRLKWN